MKVRRDAAKRRAERGSRAAAEGGRRHSLSASDRQVCLTQVRQPATVFESEEALS